MQNVKFISDTRFLGDFQMLYRVERQSQVLGSVRKVNHGRERWLLFNEAGERLAKGTTRHSLISGL